MAQSPEELKREIEQTRQDMSRDVDAISDKVSPGRIVQRRVDRTKSSLGSVKERVMGSASTGTSTLGDKASSAQSSMADAVTGAPQAAMSRTQGNPLAAGLLAFATGWLVASLLPASQAEQQAVLALEDKVKEPVKDHLTGIAHEIKDDMQESTQDAVQSVMETATDAAQTLKNQGSESAQNVKSQTQDATDEDRESAGQSTL
jgi:gas vesicle protein